MGGADLGATEVDRKDRLGGSCIHWRHSSGAET